MSETSEHRLLLRVLADAERRAAEGCVREGVVLLRWAARIAEREQLPFVLLSYHRILGRERRSGAHGQAGERTETHPVLLPQFPEVAPVVERIAFVPSREVTRPPRKDSIMKVPPRGRRTRYRAGWIGLIGLCGAVALMVRPDGLRDLRSVPASTTGGRLDAVPSEAPGLLLTSARESIVSGDSSRARAHLRRVLEDPRASVAEYAEAARLLIRLDAFKQPHLP